MEILEGLCKIQCTMGEIANFFNVNQSTVERRVVEATGSTFAAFWDSKKGAGRVSLRRMQWRMAENNPTLQIWLGKNILGQRDERFFSGGSQPLRVTGVDMSKLDDETLLKIEEAGFDDDADTEDGETDV
jgi:hypothetical protein